MRVPFDLRGLNLFGSQCFVQRFFVRHFSRAQEEAVQDSSGSQQRPSNAGLISHGHQGQASDNQNHDADDADDEHMFLSIEFGNPYLSLDKYGRCLITQR